MRYQQLGEHRGIGATAHFLQIADKNIVVDFGVALESQRGFNIPVLPEGDFLKGKRIDLIVITHSHFDHVGALPRLMSRHPEAMVMMTRQTFESSKIILADSLKINKRARAEGVVKDLIFDGVELSSFQHSRQLELIEADELPCWLDIWPGWEIGFAPAGHHVGAMMVFISPPNHSPVFITGDVSAHNQETVMGAMLPDEKFLNGFLDEPGVVMITEATNGYRNATESREDRKWRMGEFLNEVHVRGGQVLFPVFAQNRAANITKILVEMGFTPWIDGMARKLLHLELPETRHWLEDEKIFFFDETDWENADRQRCAVARGQYGFAPIISPSASLDKGLVVEHAINLMSDKRNAVVFTGHIFDNSVAQQVMGARPGTSVTMDRLKQSSVVVPVSAQAKYFDFSAHDYQDALVERVCLAKPSNLIVHHADQSGLSSFWSAVKAAFPDSQTGPTIRHGRHLQTLGT